MRRHPSNLLLLLAALAGIAASACQSGGVGDPCVPEDEYVTSFAGYDETQINVESRSFQCESRFCLVANFRGRVSCPYGQPVQTTSTALADSNKSADNEQDPSQNCYIPGAKVGDESSRVTVAVQAQLFHRRPEQAVYCSCRCAGDDSSARYCTCPSGFVCQKLIDATGSSGGQLGGSYCIKDGTQVKDPTLIDSSECETANNNCGSAHPNGI